MFGSFSHAFVCVCACVPAQHWNAVTGHMTEDPKTMPVEVYVQYFALLHSLLLPDEDLTAAQREKLVRVGSRVCVCVCV